MPRAVRETTVTDLENIRHAAALMRTARKHLRAAGAKKSAQYVARALKSVEGAERHAYNVTGRKMVGGRP